MTIGALAQFVLYQQMLMWPIREMGWIIAMGQEASAAAERVFELLDTPPDIADEPGATPLERQPRRDRARGRVVPVPGERGAGSCKGVDLHIRSGRDARARRHDRVAARRRSPRSCRASTTRRPGRVTLDGRDLADDHGQLAALARDRRVRGPDPVLGLDPREHPDGQAGRRPTTTSGTALRGRAGRRVRPRAAVGPRHARRRAGLLALRRTASARRARARRDRPSADPRSWTTRCRRWTSTRRPRSRRRCATSSSDSTALLIAHRPSTLLLADRVAFLHEGRVHAVGTHHDLLGDRAAVPPRADGGRGGRRGSRRRSSNGWKGRR